MIESKKRTSEKDEEVLVAVLCGKEFTFTNWTNFKFVDGFFVIENDGEWVGVFCKEELRYMAIRPRSKSVAIGCTNPPKK